MTGRGFYMALICCVMAIGLSGWYLWRAFQTASTLNTAPANGAAHVTTQESDEETAEASVPPSEPAVHTPSADFDAEDDAEETAVSDAPSEVVGQTATEAETPVTAPADIPAEEEIPPAALPAAEETPHWQMPVEGDIAMAFSRDALSYNAAMGDWRIHEGVDLAAGFGDEVLSACAGTVSSVENDLYLGWTVRVDCGNGLTAIYGNLAEDCPVDVGDELSPGDLIGAVGDTAPGEACSTAWLHFAVEQNGEPVDPMDYLPS